MKKLLIALLALALWAGTAAAQTLNVFADKAYQPALREVVPLFTQKTGFEAKLTCGRSAALAERIVRAKKSPDVFFPAETAAMQLVMERGLIDVALKRNVLALPPPQPAEGEPTPGPEYVAAAVLRDSAHRLQAMAFLEFLGSEPARAVFARHGFALP
ncbi:MAG TPA: substrate-binding domain-containing protein [Kiritimatiellia bacterium]|nr:substrate-binding domain-containing protein [Kiritimatiellia bacterium]